MMSEIDPPATSGEGPGRASVLTSEHYDVLHVIARKLLGRERIDHTLQPTALVNEAFIRLARHPDRHWSDRAHFLASAATIMRHLLINHAQQHRAAKRGGGARRVDFTNDLADPAQGTSRSEDWLLLHTVLEEFALLDSRRAQVVEMRTFGGMTVAEVATALDISVSTVESDWRLARAWLVSRMAANR